MEVAHQNKARALSLITAYATRPSGARNTNSLNDPSEMNIGAGFAKTG
jgi:hypothetical protein